MNRTHAPTARLDRKDEQALYDCQRNQYWHGHLPNKGKHE